MPRLRRLRDYEWEPSDEDFPEISQLRSTARLSPQQDETPVDADTNIDTNTDACYEGYEASTDESWLSNAAIVAGIPDDRLRSTLQRYKSLIRLLETEILARGVTPRKNTRRYTASTIPTDRQARSASSPTTSVRLRRTRQVKMNLNIDQLLQALKTLEALRAKR